MKISTISRVVVLIAIIVYPIMDVTSTDRNIVIRGLAELITLAILGLVVCAIALFGVTKSRDQEKT